MYCTMSSAGSYLLLLTVEEACAADGELDDRL